MANGKQFKTIKEEALYLNYATIKPSVLKKNCKPHVKNKVNSD